MRSVAVAALLVAGCAPAISAHVMSADSVRRDPVSPNEVVVFTQEPARPYDVIALVELTDEGAFTYPSIEDIRARLRLEAAKLGADAVILVAATDEVDALLSGERTASGRVIVWR